MIVGIHVCMYIYIYVYRNMKILSELLTKSIGRPGDVAASSHQLTILWF